MLQQTADVPAGEVGQAGVVVLVVEQRLAALPQRLVAVHAGAVVLEQRLGHEGHRLAGRPGHVLDDVLVEHHLVGHGQQGVELHVDLGLAGRGDLVVLDLDLDAHRLQLAHHLGAQVLEVVGGRDREVALLVAGLVPEVQRPVGVLHVGGVPGALDGVDLVHRRPLVLAEPHAVEDEELGLGPEVRRVGDRRRAQVVLRLLGDVAGVAGVRLTGDRVVHEAVDVQRLVLAERIDHRRVGIGDQEHVGLLDLLEPTDRRTVEPVALLEVVLGQLVGRDREVLHQARQVAEAKVDELDAVVLRQLEDLRWRPGFHALPSLGMTSHERRCRLRRVCVRRSPAVAVV